MGVEEGETILGALQRELLEEAGFHLVKAQPVAFLRTNYDLEKNT